MVDVHFGERERASSLGSDGTSRVSPRAAQAGRAARRMRADEGVGARGRVSAMHTRQPTRCARQTSPPATSAIMARAAGAVAGRRNACCPQGCTATTEEEARWSVTGARGRAASLSTLAVSLAITAPALTHPPRAVAQAAAVPAQQDVKVTSFDGTQLDVNFYPGDRPDSGADGADGARGVGVGSAGVSGIRCPRSARSASARSEFGSDQLGPATLNADGYNVVTWDARGWYALGRPGRDRQPLLRGPRRERDHQLAGDAPRGSPQGPQRPGRRHDRRELRRRRPAVRRPRSTIASTRSSRTCRGTRWWTACIPTR